MRKRAGPVPAFCFSEGGTPEQNLQDPFSYDCRHQVETPAVRLLVNTIDRSLKAARPQSKCQLEDDLVKKGGRQDFRKWQRCVKLEWL
jgi:hypothetical protein